MARNYLGSKILWDYSTTNRLFNVAMILVMCFVVFFTLGLHDNNNLKLTDRSPPSTQTRPGWNKDAEQREREADNTGYPHIHRNTDYEHKNPGLDAETSNGDNQQESKETGTDEWKIPRLPKALIIGVAKCGTTALLEFLSLHPDLECAHKELQCFCPPTYKDCTREQYRKWMPPSYGWQIAIEKSPCYYNYEAALQRIREFNSTIKIMVVVKEPIKRLLSKRGQTQARLDEAEPNHRDVGHIDKWILNEDGSVSNDMITYGTYNKRMDIVYRYFKKDQVLVVDGDKLITDPLPELSLVESFLGVRHFLGKRDIFFNATKGFYCFRKRSTGQTKCFGENKGRNHETPSPEVLKTLKEFIRPYSLKFLRSIDKHLDWGL